MKSHSGLLTRIKFTSDWLLFEAVHKSRWRLASCRAIGETPFWERNSSGPGIKKKWSKGIQIAAATASEAAPMTNRRLNDGVCLEELASTVKHPGIVRVTLPRAYSISYWKDANRLSQVS